MRRVAITVALVDRQIRRIERELITLLHRRERDERRHDLNPAELARLVARDRTELELLDRLEALARDLRAALLEERPTP